MKETENCYDLMDSLRKRPAMYLGNLHRNSFGALIAFLIGLSWAELEEGNPPFWCFSQWIPARVKEMYPNNMHWQWMETEWGNDKAFDMFFTLLDEYRKCEIHDLYRAVVQPHHKPKFYRIGVNSERIEPEKPIEIRVAQFVPSEVYYLSEIYTDNQKENSSYTISIEEVKREANSRWGVVEAEWSSLA